MSREDFDRSSPFGDEAYKAYARHTDPETSHAAAAGISASLTSIQRQVMKWARERGRPFHDLQLQEAMGDHGSTFRTRRREPVKKGLICDTGARIIPENRKRSFIVWKLTTDGLRIDL